MTHTGLNPLKIGWTVHCLPQQPFLMQGAASGIGSRNRERSLSCTRMYLRLGACTIRGAFSHVPFIQSVIWATKEIILTPAPGNFVKGMPDQGPSALDKVSFLPCNRHPPCCGILPLQN